MRRTVSILAICLLSTPAFASDIRAVVADAYGNAVITTQGGAKIIAVGQADLADTFAASKAEATEGKNCR
ncbi:MAG: hypothetical protein ACRCT6_04000, partial [Notoacmeibacter sp.]